MVKSSCNEKFSVKRGVWNAEEDAKMLTFASKHGSGNLTSVPKKIGLQRCGKSCRIRWTNYLKPDLKHDNFTTQEEDLIIKLHAAIGSRWSIIAQQLPGRTDSDVKNYWNTKLKKKLSQMGIDPVTHKPFSKLIADYGNIGGYQKPSTQIVSVNKDFKNAMMLKSDPLPQEFRNIIDQPKQIPKSPPKVENTGNNFLFNIKNHSAINNLSNGMDFENENETILAPVIGEGCLSKTSSPSTSTCFTSSQETFPVPFSWNDFLLEDAFTPPNYNQEEEIMVSNDLMSQVENVRRQSWNTKEVKSQQASNSDIQFSSSSEISFVQAMLDQENEMFPSFPHLMEEPSSF